MAQVNQVSKDTWGRMGLLLLALVNQGLTMSGKHPLSVSDSDVYLLFTMLFTAGAAIWGFWKNNSFTKHAIAAQAHLDQLRTVSSSAPPPSATEPAPTTVPGDIGPSVTPEANPTTVTPPTEQGGV